MRSFSNHELLRLWEAGVSLSTVQRACSLLGVVEPGVSPGEIACQSIGARDTQLLKLRERIFGSNINCYTTCPACAARLEVRFGISDVSRRSAAQASEPFVLSCARYDLSFRLPNSVDVDALSTVEGAGDRERRVFERCIVAARRDGCAIDANELPNEVMIAVSRRMAEIDPQGDVRVDISCPDCAHQWQSPFDIASFLWDEIQAWSVRLLRDVHTIADAYGWSETEILNLSSWRRQTYLELIGK